MDQPMEDEINLVRPGFNSGWGKVQGIWERYGEHAGNIVVDSSPKGLEYFKGKGKYSAPELSWYDPIGITALKFLDSDKLGKRYQYDLFVGDSNSGNLYHFDLTEKKRTELLLNGPLHDKVVDHPQELQEGKMFFGRGFGLITDIQVGPDGLLYILSLGQTADYIRSINHQRFKQLSI